MLLKDKVALITGGAGLNGLGFATAKMMSAHGARVVLLDLERADPAGAAAQLGPQHLGWVADLFRVPTVSPRVVSASAWAPVPTILVCSGRHSCFA